MNILEKLFSDIEEAEQSLLEARDDYLIGCTGKLEQAVAMERVNKFKERLEYCKNKLKRTEEYLDCVGNNIHIKESDLTKKELPMYSYFLKFLNNVVWLKSPANTKCAHCSRTATSRTGIVYTLDPQTQELVDICTYCYINRK